MGQNKLSGTKILTCIHSKHTGRTLNTPFQFPLIPHPLGAVSELILDRIHLCDARSHVFGTEFEYVGSVSGLQSRADESA